MTLHKKRPNQKDSWEPVALDLAYREGKPVEKLVTVHADVEDFPALIEKLNQSPAFLAKISEQKTLEGEQSTPIFPEAH